MGIHAQTQNPMKSLRILSVALAGLFATAGFIRAEAHAEKQQDHAADHAAEKKHEDAKTDKKADEAKHATEGEHKSH